ncbi:hypothetical protein ACJJTC_019075 [Scirpophaga incertulas]
MPQVRQGQGAVPLFFKKGDRTQLRYCRLKIVLRQKNSNDVMPLVPLDELMPLVHKTTDLCTRGTSLLYTYDYRSPLRYWFLYNVVMLNQLFLIFPILSLWLAMA